MKQIRNEWRTEKQAHQLLLFIKNEGRLLFPNELREFERNIFVLVSYFVATKAVWIRLVIYSFSIK